MVLKTPLFIYEEERRKDFLRGHALRSPYSPLGILGAGVSHVKSIRGVKPPAPAIYGVCLLPRCLLQVGKPFQQVLQVGEAAQRTGSSAHRSSAFSSR
ncbi:MAG: hypothetical protein ACHBN1_26940 [Heteroscytonema crispum UTEX LB 1556]